MNSKLETNVRPKSARVVLAVAFGIMCLHVVSGCSPERDRESQLVVAARANDVDKVRKLLDEGVSVNAKETVQGEGRSALYHAASNGATSVIRLLISRGAEVNESINGRPTPLMAAAVAGHAEVVSTLLDAGAAINAREGKTGATALTDAVRKGHVEVVKILIVKGADVSVQLKDGNTPLSWAKARGYSEIEKLLMAAGAK